MALAIQGMLIGVIATIGIDSWEAVHVLFWPKAGR